MTLHTSPLDAAHRALGAKLVPFGGWDMPLNYPAGTLAEHQACRTAAVAFDVSHLGTVRVTGPDALERLQAALTNDLALSPPSLDSRDGAPPVTTEAPRVRREPPAGRPDPSPGASTPADPAAG